MRELDPDQHVYGYDDLKPLVIALLVIFACSIVLWLQMDRKHAQRVPGPTYVARRGANYGPSHPGKVSFFRHGTLSLRQVPFAFPLSTQPVAPHTARLAGASRCASARGAAARRHPRACRRLV